MTEPLALIVGNRVVPQTQLLNRLQELGYRVQSISSANALVEQAEQIRPMVVLADLEPGIAVCRELNRLRTSPTTSHVPIIAFAGDEATSEEARKTGVNLVVSEAAVLAHLPQFLDQALQVD